MAVNYANGFVPSSALAPLDGQPGCFLRADAAAAWNAGRAEVKRRTGIVLMVRGWNRTYAEQVTFYLQRHRLAKAGERVCCYWQDRPYVFTGTAHAAPPGTSNHGWGLAVDVIDFGNVGDFSNPRRVKAFPILAQYGWTDHEGRGEIREPWHLVWNPSSAYAVNNPIGGGGNVPSPTIPGTPGPIAPEEDMDAAQNAALGETWNLTKRNAQILEALVEYVLDPKGRGNKADSRVLGAIPDLRNADGTVATVLTTAEGQILRNDIAAVTGADGQVDVAALAAALKDSLGAAVADELANRLKGA